MKLSKKTLVKTSLLLLPVASTLAQNNGNSAVTTTTCPINNANYLAPCSCLTCLKNRCASYEDCLKKIFDKVNCWVNSGETSGSCVSNTGCTEDDLRNVNCEFLLGTNSATLIPSSNSTISQMKLNFNGLPTPWPVAFVNMAFSVIGIIAAKSKIGLLKWLMLCFSLTRSNVILIACWHSLRINGISSFYYPALAFLPLIDIIFLLNISEIFINREERASLSSLFSSSVFPKGNWGRALVVILFFLGYLPVFSYIWEIVALGIYSGRRNFLSSAQFITTCSQTPNVPWETMIRCTKQNNETFSCLIGIKNIWIIDLFLRAIGFFSLFSPALVFTKKRTKKEEIKIGSRIISGVNFLVLIFYIISVGIIQARGLNTVGLEKVCDLNSTLLSSKTGYFREWANQQLTSTNEGIVVIGRKITLF